MRKLFLTLSFAVFSLWLCGQNENPYSQFGYESPIMPERQINNLDSVLTIINPDTSLIIGWITVNTKNRIILMYSRDSIVIARDTLLSYTTTRWLSPDPAGQFHSPYLGMGNNPISGVDPDGQWYWKDNVTGDQVWKSGFWENAGAMFSSRYTLNTATFTNPDGSSHFVRGDVYFIDGTPYYCPTGGVTVYSTQITGSYLEFNATQSPGRARMDGTLSWIDTYRNGDVKVRQSWTAVSGSRTLRPIPAHNDWQLSNYRVRTEEGFSRDNFGFSLDITPDPRDGRTSLRIHPDGGLPGTAGCIGLNGTKPQLQQFARMSQNYLSVHGTMRLVVNY